MSIRYDINLDIRLKVDCHPFNFREIGTTKTASAVTTQSATSFLTAQTTMMVQMVDCTARNATETIGDPRPDLPMLIIN